MKEDATFKLPLITSVVLEEAAANSEVLEMSELTIEELCRLGDDRGVGVAPTPGRVSILVLPISRFIALLKVAELGTDCSMLEVEMRSVVAG